MSDAFISYSHIDNQPYGEDRVRWVERFHEDLRTRLSMRLGTTLDLWYDHRIEGNEEFSETIRRALLGSELLMVVVSPGYLNSDWCRRERNEFLANCERHGMPLGGRLFKILKEELALTRLPECLQKRLGYQFYQGHGRPLSRAQYWDRIEDVAIDFENVLREIQQGREARKKGNVYLPDSSWDVAADRDRVRRELETRQYRVTWELPAGCLLAIHIIGSEPSPAVTIPELLTRQLVWIAPAASGSHIDQLRAEAGVRYELLEGPLSNLQNVVFDRLEPKTPLKSAQRMATDAENVYVVCDEPDESEALKVQAVLAGPQRVVILPLLRGDPQQLRQDHEESLKDANAVLVLWPRGNNAGWLRTKVRELNKAMGLGRSAPFKAKAVLTTHDESILHSGLVTWVRSIEEFRGLLETAEGAAV